MIFYASTNSLNHSPHTRMRPRIVQNVCLGRRAGDILVRSFRLLATKAHSRYLPDVRTTTRWVGNRVQRLGRLHRRSNPYEAMVKNYRMGAPAPAHALMFVTSCLVESSPQWHMAPLQASQHTNNTAELSRIIEALQFLSSLGPVSASTRVRVFVVHPQHADDVCLGPVQSQTIACLAHIAPHFAATEGTWEMSADHTAVL